MANYWVLLLTLTMVVLLAPLRRIMRRIMENNSNDVAVPSALPSLSPSLRPSWQPTPIPSAVPTRSAEPSAAPSAPPSTSRPPSAPPSSVPSVWPTTSGLGSQGDGFCCKATDAGCRYLGRTDRIGNSDNCFAFTEDRPDTTIKLGTRFDLSKNFDFPFRMSMTDWNALSMDVRIRAKDKGALPDIDVTFKTSDLDLDLSIFAVELPFDGNFKNQNEVLSVELFGVSLLLFLFLLLLLLYINYLRSEKACDGAQRLLMLLSFCGME